MIIKGQNTKTIWTMQGNQGDMWKMADVDITTTDTFRIAIQGIRGYSFLDDIAVDDIVLKLKNC